MLATKIRVIQSQGIQTKLGLVIGGINFWWEFSQLFKHSLNLPTKFVEIEKLNKLDTDHWFESRSPQPTLHAIAAEIKRIERADTTYPCIIISGLGMVDGSHRMMKAHLSDRTKIKCVEFTISDLMEIPHSTS